MIPPIPQQQQKIKKIIIQIKLNEKQNRHREHTHTPPKKTPKIAKRWVVGGAPKHAFRRVCSQTLTAGALCRQPRALATVT